MLELTTIEHAEKRSVQVKMTGVDMQQYTVVLAVTSLTVTGCHHL
jgi:hypothetical protein